MYRRLIDALCGLAIRRPYAWLVCVVLVSVPAWMEVQNLGLDSLGLQIEFFLSRAADAATLDVCVRENGESDPVCAPVTQTTDGDTSGYFYDPLSNSIVFNPLSVPERGSRVEVYYETFCY